MSASDGPAGDLSGQVLDIADCAREPIHIPGSIQPYGALFVLSPADLTIEQAGVAPGLPAVAPGRPVNEALPTPDGAMLANLAARVPDRGVVHLGVLRLQHADGERACHAIAHRSDGAIVLELEEAVATEPGSFEELYPRIRDILENLQAIASVDELAELAVREVRRLTGFDRALVYRFDAEWNGTVIAEDRNEMLPSYLGLRFPASDIPAQARELYRLNRLRLIADANYEPVAIEPAANPATGRPIDLSFAVLRSVSPVHLEYMRNMGTGASMSISLLREGRLWGLISCHNRTPRRVPYHVRAACDFVGQILSLQLEGKEHAATAERRITLRAIQARLLAYMAGEDQFTDGLVKNPHDLLRLVEATGAAVIVGEQCVLVGETPSEMAVRSIVEWLAGQVNGDIYSTDELASVMPGAETLKAQASGLLAVSISQLHSSYVLWFRPEVIRTVRWGGDPHKRAETEPAGLRLHPRKSFETWRETVQRKSLPWHPTEVEAAGELRTAIVDIVLRRAEELAELSEQLTRSNKELEAFSYSVSHDLRAPFRHIVGYAQLLKQYEGDRLTDRGNRFVDTIIESAVSAGTLVDDLLSFSQMGRATLNRATVDMSLLVEEVKRRLMPDIGKRRIDWKIGELGTAYADPTMLRLVMQNLLENAIKFTRGSDPAKIEIGCEAGPAEHVWFVRDNGAGFDMAYVGKLFGVFQRLHRIEEYEGTGIGLANVKRIIERHGGRAWAEGEVDRGATLYFALPNRGRER
jgi:light-regulated signal transduction histidine kinase (bacteriophytochrome)